MPVLYRKYRPQTFAEVVGQKSIIKTLQNQAVSGAISHAYLFVGSRGVGKTSVARILAKAINCKNPGKDGDACGKCEVCLAVQNGNFIDLIEIDAASNTGVDNVRELIEHVRFAPGTAKYKVFIIDEVHMLSKGAFNALLKTLEEPPKHAIFILATTEVGKVPATIISRTQRFDFKRLSLEEAEHHLMEVIKKESMELPEEAVKLIAGHSEGGLRDALSLLDKVFTLGNKPSLEEVLQLIGITDTAFLEKLLELIVLGQAKEIPEFLDQLLEKGTDFTVFSRDFLEYLRKILILKITAQGSLTSFSEARQNKARELTEKLSENEIIFITRLFLRSLKEQNSAPSSDLPVLLASVEAALRKNGNGSSIKQNTIIQKEVKPVTPPTSPKIEVSDSTIKALVEEQVKVVSIESLESAVASITQAEVTAQWLQVIEKLKNINGPLAQLFKTSPIERVDGARIILSVKYKFNKQNLEHPKNQESVGKILKELYGLNLAVSGEVRQEEKEVVPAGGLSDALKVFGGELVD